MRSSLAVLALAFSACNSTPAVGVVALYDTSVARDDFFALPWPSDTRLKTGADGKKRLDLTGFHNAGGAIGDYLRIFGDQPTDGFGTIAGVYFRFDAAIDPASLPAAAADSLSPAATAFLLDVTPGSPTAGKRTPIRASFRTAGGLYMGPNGLILVPEPGFPLREHTTYAAVVTDGVRAADGGPVRRDERFTMPALPLPLDVDPAHVIVATVYTTATATSIMKDLRDAVYAQAPAPQVADLQFIETDRDGRYDHFEGTYQAPNFQEGDPPYLKAGGRLHFGVDGKPQVVRMETLRFALTIPHADVPAEGWPVVLYAHGTGGGYTSFIDDRSCYWAAKVQDINGKTVSRMAMISIDQVLHGPRDPSGNDPEITFYNFQNIEAARANIKQGALDDFSLVRLVESFTVDMAPGINAPIHFDKRRIYFKGHSQGGSTGPLFLAFEPKIKAAVLSGAGADLTIALLGKTQPNNIPKLVSSIVGEDIDPYHPLLNLLQTYLESADPGNYARYFFREPPAGVPPKSIYQSLGVVDHFTPIPTIKALALAMGVQPVTPDLEEIETLGLTPQTWASPPLANNVADGKVTGVLCEYKVPNRANGNPAYDGHFVVFDNPTAVRQSNVFLGTHAATGTATLQP